MLIVKMGREHINSGINCQDFAIQVSNFKMITDGCSSCKNSEVGAKLFCHMFPKMGFNVRRTFNMLRAIYDTDRELLDNLLFTTLMVKEHDSCFEVAVCGDGYIIKQRWDDTFEYEYFNYDNMPPYFAYNYIYDKSRLSKYSDGVSFQNSVFLKDEYKNIGVASDGIQYILESTHKDEFEKILLSGKEVPMKLFINRNIQEFKDDISIVL